MLSTLFFKTHFLQVRLESNSFIPTASACPNYSGNPESIIKRPDFRSDYYSLFNFTSFQAGIH